MHYYTFFLGSLKKICVLTFHVRLKSKWTRNGSYLLRFQSCFYTNVSGRLYYVHSS